MKARELLERGKVGPLAGMRIFLSTPVDYITSKPNHWAAAKSNAVVLKRRPRIILEQLLAVDLHVPRR
jgi:hypothetical protein